MRTPNKEVVVKLMAEWVAQGSPDFSTFATRLNLPGSTVKRYLVDYAIRHGLKPATPGSGSAKKRKARTMRAKHISYEAALSTARGDHSKAAASLGVTKTEFAENLTALDIKGFYREVRSKQGVYVVTSAQNATPVNAKFLASLLGYCRRNKAELVIIPIRYKNPTSLWAEVDVENDWWDQAVVPYLCDTRQSLNANLSLLADIKNQPTAVDPLTGYEALTGSQSCILGHPKVALRTVPTSSGSPKILMTTGSVTQPNFSNTRAGKRGEFNHSFAAVVLETVGAIFHARHVSAVPDGSFIDLDLEYSGATVRKAPPAACLILGDIHVQFMDTTVMGATLGRGDSIAGRLKPKNIVWHDVLDFYSKNHHHKHKPFLHVAKRKSGIDRVETEVREAFATVNKYAKLHPTARHIFPESNHHAAFTRWMEECDWRSDPVNAEFYLTTALHMVKGSKIGDCGGETPNPFVYWGGLLLDNPKGAVFLAPDEEHKIKDIDVSNHGHLGPNGTRGSLKGLSKIGTKTVIGHSHSPGIFEGAYQVGTSSKLRLEYNKGPSGWLHTHAVIYANGKRTLITIIAGKYTNYTR